MNAECRETRRQLTGSPDGAPEHLGRCAECTRFAARVAAARRWFREHHAGVEPDARFVERVTARLPGSPAEPLAWAAVRLLPVTLALLLGLAWFSWQAVGNADPSLDLSPTENVLTWVIDRSGAAQ